MNINDNVCVSLGKIDSKSVKSAVSTHNFLEFRLDLLERSNSLLNDISETKKALVTFHKTPPFVGLTERNEWMLKSISAGCFCIDLDVEDEMLEVEEKARKHFIKILRSYHNYTETPSEIELEKILFNAKRNSDFVKIATKINKFEDTITLLNLLKSHKDLIVVGIGELGVTVRLVAPLLGSPWTYASLEEGLETAPGQINAKHTANFLNLFREDY